MPQESSISQLPGLISDIRYMHVNVFFTDLLMGFFNRTNVGIILLSAE